MERWATLRYGKSGHRWLDWLTDLDRSGVTIDRPALNKARDLAIAERASIVVYDMTLYSRSVPEGLSALERLAVDLGIKVANLQAILSAVSAAGGRVDSFDERVARIADPDGNVIRLVATDGRPS